MPEIPHQKIASLLKETPIIPIFLLHGDEYLYQKATQKIIESLLPQNQRTHNCMVIDGGDDAMIRALNELNTFSFLEHGKIVIVNDAGIFDQGQSQTFWAAKIQSALKEDHLKKAAHFFLNFLARSGYTLDDVTLESKTNKPTLALTSICDQNSMARLIQYCSENNLTPAKKTDHGDVIQQKIENGFPANHHLIITTDTIDRRQKLFKAIKENGVVIDCRVPTGERKADKEAQRVVLNETLHNFLAPYKKRMAPTAFHRLSEMTGFDLHLFSHNLQKLVDFVGNKPVIREEDVTAIVSPSRQEPIYAFTNAILDRNAAEALFFLKALLNQEMHPLQVLTAMVRQVRKLLMAKDFALSSEGNLWEKGCSYARFTTKVLPKIEAYDRKILTLLGSWQKEMGEPRLPVKASVKSKKKKSTKSVSSDLILKKKSTSPYPIYQLMLRTDYYNRKEILASLQKLSQADFQLKTSARPPIRVLEDVIFFICKPSITR
jgi:DNA polymerase-3 subunit delta